MLQALSVLKAPSAGPRRCSESLVFYLHYRATFLVLVFACLVVSSQELFGDRIQCSASPDRNVRAEMLNSYCWAASTYSVSSAYYKEVGVEVPHPGVGASEDETEYVYRNYYQYIHMVLFLQALLFYLPHLIWKGVDHDRLKDFYALLLDSPVSPPSEEDKTTPCNSVTLPGVNSAGNSNSIHCKPCNSAKEDKSKNPALEAAAAYIVDRWGTNSEYALMYVACESLSVVNLLAQCYFLNVFLHGEFLGLGHFFSPYYSAGRLKEPIQMFPLVTNCYFKKYGAPGFVDTVDAICVLPINALNVKIFLFVWIWFAALLGLSLWSVLDLCLSWCVPLYRTLFLKWKWAWFKSKISQAPYLQAVNLGDFGDWFVLRGIKKGMDPLDFSRLMEVLWAKLSTYEIETKEA